MTEDKPIPSEEDGNLFNEQVAKEPENTGTVQAQESIRDELGRIKPGHSLNPAGKPKGVRHLSTLMNEFLLKTARGKDGKPLLGIDGEEATYAELFIQKTVLDAIQHGKQRELIFERIEGKAPQSIDITSNGETMAPTTNAEEIKELARKVSAELKILKTGIKPE